MSPVAKMTVLLINTWTLLSSKPVKKVNHKNAILYKEFYKMKYF